MSVICILLATVTVAFAIGCISFRRKGKAFEGMMCKFMASFGFISIAVVGYCTNPVDTYYFCIVCFALLFGFCGDILLGIKEVAPTLFKYAGPPCVSGPCPEGKMSCGKMAEMRALYNDLKI